MPGDSEVESPKPNLGSRRGSINRLASSPNLSAPPSTNRIAKDVKNAESSQDSTE